ncbi:MAG: glycosyltransferase, partial [Planctomycetota bacterium]
MSELPFVSVIIPARNAAGTLPECLIALRTQSYPKDRFEVIVVDDASTDSTAEVAQFFWAKVVQVPPSGPGGARNAGVRESKGELLFFTDADCAPNPQWMRSLVDAFDDPSVSAAKGTYRSEQETGTAKFVQAEYESRYRIMRTQDSIDFIDTYSAAYRRDVFEKLGGFDGTLPVGEDQDLSFRLAKTGARAVTISSLFFCLLDRLS